MTDLKALLDAATPGEWNGHNLVHADGGRPMTPEEIGEYVKNSVKMGDPDKFLFVSGDHPDGGTVDICHTGNGPRGAANTALIALARKNAERVLELEAALEQARQAVKVKPLVWAGLYSGPYYITVTSDGVGNLYCLLEGEEDGQIEPIFGGYLSLRSIDELKAKAQEHHNNYILSAITTEVEA